MNLNGGYIIINKDDANIHAKASEALIQGKPILFYEDNTTCYYIDTISLSGTSVVLTKGGKTITITDANAVTESGDIQAHLYNYYASSVYLQTTAYGEIRGTWMFTAIEDDYDINSTDFDEINTGLRKILDRCGIINVVNADSDTTFTGTIYLDNSNKIIIEGYFTSQSDYNSVVFSTLESDNSLDIEITWNKSKLF